MAGRDSITLEDMPMSLKYLARMAVRRVAADPRAREKAKEAAQMFADEVRKSDPKKGRAYAAGRAVGRTLKRLQGDSESS